MRNLPTGRTAGGIEARLTLRLPKACTVPALCTTMGDKFADVEVSLEPQLLESLVVLSKRLPESLALELRPYLAPSISPSKGKTNTIPYALLLHISKWTRTDEGAEALRGPDSPLEPASYSMVALLAGTRTSPNRIFPPAPRPLDDPKREINDRKAIVTVLNALMSIIGAGAAAWYAAHSVGWRDEWVRAFLLHHQLTCSHIAAVHYVESHPRAPRLDCGRSRRACALSHLGGAHKI
jgi:hypothetical protein